MIEFEVRPFAASSTVRAHVRALRAVAFDHRAARCGRDVRCTRGCILGGFRSRTTRLSVLPALQLLNVERERRFEDLPDVRPRRGELLGSIQERLRFRAPVEVKSERLRGRRLDAIVTALRTRELGGDEHLDLGLGLVLRLLDQAVGVVVVHELR
ncbi:MAG: hypothetical protein RIT81_22715, partial [Deltaproteobacteria bacterium]